jgi:hemerythrin superfamily protein
MNALTLLRNDHKEVEKLFKQFEKLGDEAHKQKQAIVKKIIRDLSIHAAIEEQVFYPAVRKAVKNAEDEVLEGLEEHHIVKWTLSELVSMQPSDERFDAKVTVLIESVRHHVKDEQEEMFPKVTKKLDRKQLEMLGKALEAAKKTAPTKPHPRAPDTPPGNLVAGAGASMLDRGRDLVGAAMANGRKRLAKATSRTAANGKPRGRQGRAHEARAAH